MTIDNEKILVSQDGMKTCIYVHAPNHTATFHEDNWRMLVHLEEIDHQRIETAVMASDFFILANNEFQFYMFDTIGYKIVD